MSKKMATETINPPGIMDAPQFFEDMFTDDKDEIGNDPIFPDAVIMLSLGGGKYCAVNCTTTGPDPMTVGCLVCFANEKEAEIWEEKYMSGEKVNKEFQEARKIAIDKPNIAGLALQKNATTVNIHWVR